MCIRDSSFFWYESVESSFVIDIIVISATDRPGDDVVLRPTNTITVVGNTITLPCTSRVHNESRWDFYAIDAVKPINIYNGVNVQRRVIIDFNSCRLKTCNLTIESVELSYAGYYVCFESSSPVRKAASLVVLGRLSLLLLSSL